MDSAPAPPARSRRDSVGSSSNRKRKRTKSEPTSTVRVVLSTLMVYLSYQILTREDDDLSKTEFHIPTPHLNLDAHRPNWAHLGGDGRQGGHAGFPDPYGLGHQIAGIGSNLLHHGNIHKDSSERQPPTSSSRSMIMRILGGIGSGIYTVFYFIYRSLNSTLLLILSLAYYLASPLTSIFLTLSGILLSPLNVTWSAMNWVYEPVGKWIGGFVLTGVGMGAGLAWVGQHVERFCKRRAGSLREKVRGMFGGSWLGSIFRKEEHETDQGTSFEGHDRLAAYPPYLAPAGVPIGTTLDHTYPYPIYTHPVYPIHTTAYPTHLYAGTGPPYPFPQPGYYPQPVSPGHHLPHGSNSRSQTKSSESSRRTYLTSSARRAGRSKYSGTSSSESGSSGSELSPESMLGHHKRNSRGRRGSDIARQVDMLDPPTTSASSKSGSASEEIDGDGSPTRSTGSRRRRGPGMSLSERAGGKRAKAIHFHFHPGSVEGLKQQQDERRVGDRTGDEVEDGRSAESGDDSEVGTMDGTNGQTQGLRARKSRSAR